MFSAGSITGTFGLNEKPAVDAIKNVEREAVAAKQKIGPALEIAGVQGAKGFFKGLNSDLGKKSILGQSMKLMMGGGAIAGFGMAGKVLEEASAKAVDFDKALSHAHGNAVGIIDEFAKGMPIIGGVYSAGSNIRELFTHEKQAIQDANDGIARQAKLIETLGVSAKVVRDDLKKMNEELALARGRVVIPDLKAIAKNTFAAGTESINAIDKAITEERKHLQELQDTRDSDAHKKTAAKIIFGAAGGLLPENQQLKQDIKDAESSITGLEGQAALLRGKVQRDNALATETAGAITIEQESKMAREVGLRAGEALNKNNQFLQEMQASAIQARADTEIEGLRAAGKDVQAALTQIYQERDNTVIDLIKKEQAAVAQANDAGFAADAEFLLGRQIAENTALANAKAGGAISDAMKVNVSYRQLANPRLAAEELRGAKTVTTGDIPQPFVEIQRSQAEVAKNTADIAAGIKILVAQGGRVSATTIPPATLSLP